MADAVFGLGVVLERRRPVGPWAEVIWLPVAVLPGVPDALPGAALGTTATGERVYAGPADIAFHRSVTANYRDNLASGAPKLWVAARRAADGSPFPVPRVVAVTPDPAEGEAFTEAGDDIVEAVPMPAEIAAALAEFVAAHHVERAFIKRRRDGNRHDGDRRGEDDDE